MMLATRSPWKLYMITVHIVGAHSVAGSGCFAALVLCLDVECLLEGWCKTRQLPFRQTATRLHRFEPKITASATKAHGYEEGVEEDHTRQKYSFLALWLLMDMEIHQLTRSRS